MAFQWDTTRRRYLDETGKLVSSATVRRWVDDFAQRLAIIFTERANRVVQAGVDDKDRQLEYLQAWYATTRRELQDAHRAVTALAFGGFAQLTDADWAVADDANARQLGFWENFAGGIVLGTVALDATFAARSGMYGEATYGTYENGVRQREIKFAAVTGFDQERRVKAASRNCTTCLVQAALGWRGLGTLAAIGDSECRTRCRCFFQFRKRPANE